MTVGQVAAASLDALTFASPFIGNRTVDEIVRLAVTDAGAAAGTVLTADVNTAGTSTPTTGHRG